MIKKSNRKKVVHCILSDLCTSALFNPGFMVLVHAPMSCSNIIYNAIVNMQRRIKLHFHRDLPVVTDKIFITGISDKEAVFGGESLLKKSIKRVVEAKHPECLLVIAGCTAGVIGDDVQGICATEEEKYNIPILAIAGAGFLSEQENEAHLLLTKYLFNHVKDNTLSKDEQTAVVLGLNRYLQTEKQEQEITRLFAYFGYKKLILPPCGMTFSDIQKINICSLIAVHAITKKKLAAYQNFAQEIAGYLHIPFMQQVLPFSVEDTYLYLQNLGELCHKQKEADKAVETEKLRWQAACSELKKALQGKKYILAVGYDLSVNNPLKLVELLACVGMQLTEIILLASLTDKEASLYEDFFSEVKIAVPVVRECDAIKLPEHDVALASEVCNKFAVQYCYKRRRIGIGGAINFLQGISQLLASERSICFE